MDYSYHFSYLGCFPYTSNSLISIKANDHQVVMKGSISPEYCIIVFLMNPCSVFSNTNRGKKNSSVAKCIDLFFCPVPFCLQEENYNWPLFLLWWFCFLLYSCQRAKRKAFQNSFSLHSAKRYNLGLQPKHDKLVFHSSLPSKIGGTSARKQLPKILLIDGVKCAGTETF